VNPVIAERTDWEGRVAVVTGGSEGIGRGILERIVASGGRVATVGRDRALVESAVGGRERVVGISGDVRSPDTATRLVEACIDRFGSLDALINNAGYGLPEPWDVDDESWLDMYQYNVLSAVRMARATVPHLRRSPSPRIVNIGTELVFKPMADHVAYTASKAALLSFAKSLAWSLADDGILVNTVCPGTIESRTGRRFIEGRAAALGLPYDEAMRHFATNERVIPLKRLGTPAEVGEVVAFLASSANSFMTGAVVRVDGGSAPTFL
jgi:NAD(P)-dependent dehydrogenase (short-subunit alcohol dehydrogenase family)